MAKNLRSKIPKEDKLVVFDVNNKATEDFLGVFKAGMDTPNVGETTVAKDVRKVAENSVCTRSKHNYLVSMMNLYFPFLSCMI